MVAQILSHDDFWLPNPVVPTAGYPSSTLFGIPSERAKYWLPNPPRRVFPGLHAFWNRLSTGITEYRMAAKHQNGPTLSPTTASRLSNGVGPGDWVRGNGASRLSRSPNWSGATVHAVGGGTITQVVGSWVEPDIENPGALTNTQEFRSSVWIGLNGHAAFDDAALPQIGSMQQIVNGVPTPKHWVWFEWWANTKLRAQGIHRPVELPVYLDVDVVAGDTVLCSVELIPYDRTLYPSPFPVSRFVARMLLCVERQDSQGILTSKTLVMPFVVSPPSPNGRQIHPTGSTANWITELPTNIDQDFNVDEDNPFLMPRFGAGSTPPRCVTFQNCAAALAANPGERIIAERTLAVSSRVNMIGRRNQGEGPVGKIATTLMPRIDDTSFSIQVDGNLP